MTSDHDPERLVAAAEDLLKQVEELRDLAAAWDESLRGEPVDAVPGAIPSSPNLPSADALHTALSSLAGGIKSGLTDYKGPGPEGSYAAFAEWVSEQPS